MNWAEAEGKSFHSFHAHGFHHNSKTNNLKHRRPVWAFYIWSKTLTLYALGKTYFGNELRNSQIAIKNTFHYSQAETLRHLSRENKMLNNKPDIIIGNSQKATQIIKPSIIIISSFCDKWHMKLNFEMLSPTSRRLPHRAPPSAPSPRPFPERI